MKYKLFRSPGNLDKAVRNPLQTHKSSLLVEKFAVKTFAAPRSRSFPFPRTIYIIRKP